MDDATPDGRGKTALEPDEKQSSGEDWLMTRAFFRDVMRNLHDGVVVVRLDGTILFASESALRMFGYQRREVQGKPVDILVPMPYRDGHAALVRDFVEKDRAQYVVGERPTANVTGARKDGSVFQAEVSIVRAGDLLVAIVADVTVRKAAEEEARTYSSYLATVLNNLPQGVSVFDKDFRLALWNRHFVEVLDLPEDKVVEGVSFEDLIRFNAQRGEYGDDHPEDYVAMRLGQAQRFEAHRFERTRPNGRTLDVQGRPILGDDGEVLGWVSTYTDITDRKQAEEQVKRQHETLRTVIDNMPGGISLLDADLNMIACNDMMCELLDFPKSLFAEGLPNLETLLRFNAARGEYGEGDVEQIVQAALKRARNPVAHTFERERPDGRALEVRGTPMPNGGFVTVYTDITERKRVEAEAKRATQLVRDAIHYSPTYVWEVDAEGRFTFVLGADDVLGYAPEQMVGRFIGDFLCSDADDAEEGPEGALIDQAIRARKAYENVMSCRRHSNGGVIWISSSAHAIHDETGAFVGFRGVDVNVTELTQAKRELERLAHHDPLTGLANRRKFMERFELERSRQDRTQKSLALLVLDLDEFKQVNDQWGHLVGDICLKGVADLLTRSVRRIDLVARFGGEEFLVLLPETTLDEAKFVAEKLRKAMEREVIPAEGVDGGIKITVSIGLAMMPAGGEGDFDALMDLADQGVYAAKRTGRNRIYLGTKEGVTPADPT